MRNEWIGRRQAVRQTCHMRAEMRFLDGRVPIECTVIDISASGARIELAEGFECPQDFDLFIPSRSETKIAKMRRQEDNVAGVAFLKSRHDDPLVLQSIIERLARLERGYSELKKAATPAAAGERRNDDAPAAEPPLLIEAVPELMGARTEHLEQRLDALAESLADLQTTFVMSIARRDPQADHSTDIQALKSQLADLTAAMNENVSANPTTSVPTEQVAAMMAPVAETQQEVVELKSEMERLSAALGALIAPAGDHEPVQALADAPIAAAAQTSVPASADDNQQTQLQLTQLKAELAELRTAIPPHPVEPVSIASAAEPGQSGQLEAEVRDLRDSVRTLIMLVAKSLNEKTREAA
jgi:DNA repair exonuclease SbcCD ATPase subunit